MRNTRFIATALFAAALAFSTAGMAQQGAQQQQPVDVDVGDAELQSFAEASTAITEIQQDYSVRMQNADDPETANELQQQANEKMVGAVEEAGLDVETFNMIATAVQNDPELQQKLHQIDR
jgi:GTP1/Obg family GTP-binding protein